MALRQTQMTTGSASVLAGSWFDPFLDLSISDLSGPFRPEGHVLHGSNSNRGVSKCSAKEFPKTEKEFPRAA